MSERIETVRRVQDTRPEHTVGSSVIVKKTCFRSIEARFGCTPSVPGFGHVVGHAVQSKACGKGKDAADGKRSSVLLVLFNTAAPLFDVSFPPNSVSTRL